MTLNSSPSRLASPSRRSRVTPGRSSTSASFLPTSRLNRVDLPTLGRPTIATMGSGMWRALAYANAPAKADWRPPLAIRVEAAFVVKDVERRIGDHRRQRDRDSDR